MAAGDHSTHTRWFRPEPLAASRAHARRVAAWASELAANLGVEQPSREFLEKRRRTAFFLDDRAAGRLMIDLKITLMPSASVDVMGGSGGCLTDILEMAEHFDCAFEMEPWLDPGEEPDFLRQSASKHLRSLDPESFLRALPRLPVFPMAAQRALNVLMKPDVSPASLESVAKLDPAIAGELLSAANSAMFGRAREIRTIGQALVHLGMEAGRRMIYAASMRPLFASAKLGRLWNHSIESAQIAERIALLSGKTDPAEAFLGGLLHDIGQLVLSLAPADLQQRLARLREHGCESLLAERALCGWGHPEFGARLLEKWRLPAACIQAVRCHHEPEREISPLAAVLYLTEFWAAEDEDLPSRLRLGAALEQTGLTLARLYAAGLRPVALSSLKFAA